MTALDASPLALPQPVLQLNSVRAGYGTIDGRQVAVFAQDFSIFGGSLGEVYGEKIVKVMDLAIKSGIPIIGINEGAGARIQ